jgi:hypothetical protein
MTEKTSLSVLKVNDLVYKIYDNDAYIDIFGYIFKSKYPLKVAKIVFIEGVPTFRLYEHIRYNFEKLIEIQKECLNILKEKNK